MERRPVRGARLAAHRGLVALRAAALGLTLAARAAHAQAPPAGHAELLASDRVSVPDWWGAGGRAAWIADGDLGIAPAWTLAGLAVGAWRLEAAGRPGAGALAGPWPGLHGAVEPLAWSDTLVIEAGEGAAWEGYGGSLATARAGPSLLRRAGDTRKPITDLTLAQGARGMNDYAIALARGDTLRGLRLEAASGELRSVGGIAGAGRDLYALAGATTRGAHRFDGAFSHRRSNARLAGGESEDDRAEAGRIGWQWRGERDQIGASVVRGYDQHDSRGGPWSEQRRLADATAAGATFERAGARSRLGLRASWREAGVRPDTAGSPRARVRERWGAGHWQTPLADGDLDLTLGAGDHSALHRATIAPALAWRYRASPWDARITFERLANPVWSDLAAGERPFLQDTWVGGLEAGMAVAGGGHARIGFLAGHTSHRAIMTRVPLEAIALRSGVRADPTRYDFGLLTGGMAWRVAHWAVAVDGFALTRDASPLQPRLDPAAGARVSLEAYHAFFQGDLGVRPRIEAFAVGERESETGRRLPGDGMVSASLAVSIAEAVLRLEARDLTDRRIRQSWVDGATGSEALTPGREFRMTFNWRLWD